MELVAYIAQHHSGRLCDRDGCVEAADFRAVSVNRKYTDHLCARHVAQHMRGNAYAIDPDPEIEAIEALSMNELDRLR